MITIDLTKAQAIAHDLRRAARTAEFAPLDEIIAKKIPGASAQAAEAERQALRDKYTAVQAQIDNAKTPADLKKALGL